MMKTNPHACGVDDIAPSRHPYQHTPSARMMVVSWPVPNPIPGLGHFSQAPKSMGLVVERHSIEGGKDAVHAALPMKRVCPGPGVIRPEEDAEDLRRYLHWVPLLGGDLSQNHLHDAAPVIPEAGLFHEAVQAAPFYRVQVIEEERLFPFPPFPHSIAAGAYPGSDYHWNQNVR